MTFITNAARVLRRLNSHKLFAAILAGTLVFGVGGALMLRSLTKSIANQALDRLGDPNDLLDKLGDRLIGRLESKGGAIETVKTALVKRLGDMAGKKLDKLDLDALLASAKGDLVKGGLTKLDGVNIDAIIDEVTKELSTMASGEIDDVDLEALIERMVDKKLDELEAELRKYIQKHWDSYTQAARDYYEAHADEYKASAQTYYEEHPEEREAALDFLGALFK